MSRFRHRCVRTRPSSTCWGSGCLTVLAAGVCCAVSALLAVQPQLLELMARSALSLRTRLSGSASSCCALKQARTCNDILSTLERILLKVSRLAAAHGVSFALTDMRIHTRAHPQGRYLCYRCLGVQEKRCRMSDVGIDCALLLGIWQQNWHAGLFPHCAKADRRANNESVRAFAGTTLAFVPSNIIKHSRAASRRRRAKKKGACWNRSRD